MTDDNTINPAASRAVGRTVADPTPRGGQRTPLNTLEHVARELARVYRGMKCGDIATQDGTRLAYVLSCLSKTLEAVEIERRLTELERIAREQSQTP